MLERLATRHGLVLSVGRGTGNNQGHTGRDPADDRSAGHHHRPTVPLEPATEWVVPLDEPTLAVLDEWIAECCRQRNPPHSRDRLAISRLEGPRYRVLGGRCASVRRGSRRSAQRRSARAGTPGVAVHDDRPRDSDGRAILYRLPDELDDADERWVRGLPARQPTRAS